MPDPRRARLESVAAEVVDPVRRYLARRTDAATADDVLADTLLVCWRRIEEVPDPALPWVYAVARGALANARRSARRQRRLAARVAALDPPSSHAATTPEPDPRDAAVRRALAALRPDDAEVLRLWAWEHLEAADVAVVLGVSPNAAAIRLHRARGRLREQLAAPPRKDDAGAGHEWSTRGERRGR